MDAYIISILDGENIENEREAIVKEIMAEKMSRTNQRYESTHTENRTC